MRRATYAPQGPAEILATLKRYPERWKLATTICEEHRVSVEGALCRHDRHPKAMRARRRFLAILRWSTDLSYPEIGRLVGLDHTTVIHACKERERELLEEYTR